MGRPRARDAADFLRLRVEILKILDFAGKMEDLQYYL
jgi:sulfonate transport system ATP-binding protein